MINAREAVYAALFAKLSALVGQNIGNPAVSVNQAGRVLKHWNDVPAESQPAIFLTQVQENAAKVKAVPTKWVMHTKIWVYVYRDDANGPAPYMNALLDLIETALADRVHYNQQSLGGLVEDCRIQGNITTDEGFLGPQAVAVIPVEIVTSN